MFYEDDEDYNSLVALFEKVNNSFLKENMYLIETDVSERTLCSELMLSFHEFMKKDSEKYEKYHVDVEYNRNGRDVKSFLGIPRRRINIQCDLIVHSRGQNIQQDNLIALEMKKSKRPEIEKDNDRERLKNMTKGSYDGIWIFDGSTLPEYVCRYILGIYYEINYVKREVYIEYFRKGEKVDQKTIKF